ncbi:MAG: MFS transporter [Pirellulaceae bacterium]
MRLVRACSESLADTSFTKGPFIDTPAPISRTTRTGLSGNAAPLMVLMLLFGVHFIVDFFGAMVNPLWRAMEEHLSLPLGGALWIYVAWSVATSFSQLAFGLWADRGRAHWLLWFGPAVVVVCLSSLGFAHSVASLTALVVCGGLGLAAFHPEAAARAGALLPSHRSRVMAIFSLGGYLGQAAGPYCAGAQTERSGLTGLAWNVTWGGTLLLLLMVAWYVSPARRVAPSAHGTRTRRSRKSQLRRMAWLLMIGSLRVSPAMGVLLGLAYVLESQGLPDSAIGAVQSAFMAGMGAGGFCAVVIAQRWERTALCWMPIAAAPFMACIGHANEGWWLIGVVGMAGLLHGVGLPVFVSYGQQLMPTGERIANSITMGVSWGVASGLAAAAIAGFQRAGAQTSVFFFFAAISAFCGVACFGLPRVADEKDLA